MQKETPQAYCNRLWEEAQWSDKVLASQLEYAHKKIDELKQNIDQQQQNQKKKQKRKQIFYC